MEILRKKEFYDFAIGNFVKILSFEKKFNLNFF
jgi:hypothetical protein